MKFLKAKREKCKMKLSIQGASGSGKTYSALRLAKGMLGRMDKVVVIDTENGSSHLYDHFGDYSVLSLNAPYTPEKFIMAIQESIKQGFECIIIDSLSHEWQGAGGILDIHGQMEGNSFTNWSKITPRHNALIQQIVNAPVHIIATLRSKTDYILQQKNGKSIPEKVGLKPVQREDCDYEFTIAFELNRYHVATISKDRTGIFANTPEVELNEEKGVEIINWTDAKSEPHKTNDLERRIKECNNFDDLYQLYSDNPEVRDSYKHEFSSKKEELINQVNIVNNANL
jgi:hypothetical protein